MASSLRNSSVFFAFVGVVLLFCCNEHIVEGDGDLCEVPSALFDGGCYFSDENCNHNCKEYESAVSGRCVDKKCVCTRKCKENVCPRPSGRFGGPCFDYDACLHLCKGGEGAIGGSCSYFKCLCLYNC